MMEEESVEDTIVVNIVVMIYSWLKRDSIEIDDKLLSLDNEIALQYVIKEINVIQKT